MSETIDVSRPEHVEAVDKSDPFVLVGIPAYNEAATIAAVVTAAQRHADTVLVVDDGSTDETRKRARDAGATVISHETNQGYGATLGTIFQHANQTGVDHLVILDADGQHDTGDIPDLVKTQQETDAQLVTGSRFTGNSSTNMPRYRRFGLAVINLLTNLSLRVGYSYPSVSDSQCGFRAYDREAIETMAAAREIDSGMGASLDILFESAREGYDIVEVPTRIDYEVEDASSQNPIVHGFGLLKSLFLSVLHDRPVRVGVACSIVVLSSLALVFGIVQTGVTALYALAILVLTIGLVLSLTLSGRVPTRSDRTDQ